MNIAAHRMLMREKQRLLKLASNYVDGHPIREELLKKANDIDESLERVATIVFNEVEKRTPNFREVAEKLGIHTSFWIFS